MKHVGISAALLWPGAQINNSNLEPNWWFWNILLSAITESSIQPCGATASWPRTFAMASPVCRWRMGASKCGITTRWSSNRRASRICLSTPKMWTCDGNGFPIEKSVVRLKQESSSDRRTCYWLIYSLKWNFCITDHDVPCMYDFVPILRLYLFFCVSCYPMLCIDDLEISGDLEISVAVTCYHTVFSWKLYLLSFKRFFQTSRQLRPFNRL